jgi:protein pelota
MRVIHNDRRSGKMKLRMESLDDLWHLFNIIRAGDRTFSVTQRREEQLGDRIREKRGEKRTMYLGIEVEKVEFHEFSDRLRIHGTILSNQQDSGSYHTLNLQTSSEVTIVKDQWSKIDLARVHQAVEEGKRPSIVIICLDEDEALVAVLRQYGVQEVARIRSGRSGKRHVTKMRKEDYFDEVLEVVGLQGEGLPLVICGPGFSKEELLAYGRAGFPAICGAARSVSTGTNGLTGVNEVLKNGDLSKMTEGARIEFETGLMEDVLRELGTTGKVAYGKKELAGAIRQGAVETILITDTVLRERRGEIENELREAEGTGSSVVVISSGHDAGKQLDALGGYAGLLRFKLQ